MTTTLDVTSADSIAAAVAEVDRLTVGHGVDVLVNKRRLRPARSADRDLRRRAAPPVRHQRVRPDGGDPRLRAGDARPAAAAASSNVSSMGGKLTIPFMGAYNSTKYALESLSDALRLELAAFGVDVVLIEPGRDPHQLRRHRDRADRAVRRQPLRRGAGPSRAPAGADGVDRGRPRGRGARDPQGDLPPPPGPRATSRRGTAGCSSPCSPSPRPDCRDAAFPPPELPVADPAPRRARPDRASRDRVSSTSGPRLGWHMRVVVASLLALAACGGAGPAPTRGGSSATANRFAADCLEGRGLRADLGQDRGSASTVRAALALDLRGAHHPRRADPRRRSRRRGAAAARGRCPGARWSTPGCRSRFDNNAAWKPRRSPRPLRGRCRDRRRRAADLGHRRRASLRRWPLSSRRPRGGGERGGAHRGVGGGRWRPVGCTGTRLHSTVKRAGQGRPGAPGLRETASPNSTSSPPIPASTRSTSALAWWSARATGRYPRTDGDAGVELGFYLRLGLQGGRLQPPQGRRALAGPGLGAQRRLVAAAVHRRRLVRDRCFFEVERQWFPRLDRRRPSRSIRRDGGAGAQVTAAWKPYGVPRALRRRDRLGGHGRVSRSSCRAR
jgi:hypothetical protein